MNPLAAPAQVASLFEWKVNNPLAVPSLWPVCLKEVLKLLLAVPIMWPIYLNEEWIYWPSKFKRPACLIELLNVLMTLLAIPSPNTSSAEPSEEVNIVWIKMRSLSAVPSLDGQPDRMNSWICCPCQSQVAAQPNQVMKSKWCESKLAATFEMNWWSVG